MTRTRLYLILAACALAAVAAAYFVGRWSGGAGERFDKAKHKRIEEFNALERERNELRGANDAIRRANEELRAKAAEIEAREEAQQQIIREAGGRIAAEQQKLQQIEERLKNDQAVINAPADRCVRCRRLSASLLDQRVIDRPLACRDECAGQPAPQ